MEIQARVQVGEKGRIVIPAEIREAMGIGVGDLIEIRFEDSNCAFDETGRIRSHRNVCGISPPGTLVSEELNAERREAARNE